MKTQKGRTDMGGVYQGLAPPMRTEEIRLRIIRPTHVKFEIICIKLRNLEYLWNLIHFEIIYKV